MAAEILFRSDEHRFSVYWATEVPDGVPRSWGSLASDPAEYWLDLARLDRGALLWISKWTNEPPGDAHCAVLDEHAGPLLAPRFAVGMRVRLSAHGRSVYQCAERHGEVVSVVALDRGVIGIRRDGDRDAWPYDPEMWEPDPQPPQPLKVEPYLELPEAVHTLRTSNLGARHGEQWFGHELSPDHAYAAWSAHLRFLVERSAEQDRAHEAALSGWDPYGDL